MPTDEENLRKQVRARRAAVGKKISRIASTTGAKVAGTEHDPRVYLQASEINKSSAQALRIHLYELNQFMSRSTQFVGLRQGKVAPRQVWQEYKQVEENLRQRANKVESTLGNLVLPGQSPKASNPDTVQKRHDRLYRRPNQDQSFSPYPAYDRESNKFRDLSSLQQEIRRLKEKDTDAYYTEEIEREREHNRKALEYLGQDDLIQEFDALSDYQFAAMWFGTQYARITFIKYEVDKARKSGKPKEKAFEDMAENAFEEMQGFADWAGGLPEKFVEPEDKPKRVSRRIK